MDLITFKGIHIHVHFVQAVTGKTKLEVRVSIEKLLY